MSDDDVSGMVCLVKSLGFKFFFLCVWYTISVSISSTTSIKLHDCVEKLRRYEYFFGL